MPSLLKQFRAPRIVDQVELRFCADADKTLTVECVNPDGTVAQAGNLIVIADWLARNGFRYAIGSQAVWVRTAA